MAKIRKLQSGITQKQRRHTHLGFLVDKRYGIDMHAQFKRKSKRVGMSMQRVFDHLIDQFCRGTSHLQLRQSCDSALVRLEELWDKHGMDEEQWPEIQQLKDAIEMKEHETE